ncbi:hypothetical protein EGW08_023471 [Elysia chlorotica]|uniref:Reverse transcriptase domain-containing protein n=1 Tax=Elysia chlorotica TaxID=188477 RepID=A0A433SII9_ELYCH|nr:hypothetical protein EGW08_023471 [Elysia chlorotica]
MRSGLVEKFNGTLKKMLKRLCNEKPKKWHRYINALLFAYREVPQDSTHFAPFELMYGRTVRGIIDILRKLWTQDIDKPEVKSSYQYVLDLLERLTNTLELAKEQLESPQARQKKHFDKKTKSRNDETSSTVLDVSSQTRDDLNVPSCVAVVEDYDYEADNGQDNLVDDEQGSEDLPEIGTWEQKEDAAGVKFSEALTYDQNQDLQMLVEKFSYIFPDRPGDTNLAEHRIDLTSDVPVRQTPYAVPFALRSSLKKELQQMEDLVIIRKSDSPYASPVVAVKKKDGSNRVCIDFLRLNSITVTDPPQPVPSPAEYFLGMSEDKYFSKLDFTKGYHLIRARPFDVHKTAFVTMDQHYEFLRMLFGMVNSSIREGMDNVIDYIDDLLVHTKT